jgi:uncharacterized protein (TIGR02147 family)
MAPNVFEYTDYRKFLKDFYEQKKRLSHGFSYTVMAKKIGLSPTHIFLIIDGSRNVTKEHLPKLSTVLSLTKKEQQYFDALVSFNQAKTPESKRYYLEILFALKRKKEGTLISDHQYNCLSRWYYPVLLELVSLPNFNENLRQLRGKLYNKVSIREIREALETLLRVGLLKRDESGKLTRCEIGLTSEEEVKHTAVYSFHQQMLSHARDVFAVAGPEQREMSGITMALSKRQFKEIQTKIRELGDWVTNYLTNNPDTPETVFQMSMLLFPATNGDVK